MITVLDSRRVELTTPVSDSVHATGCIVTDGLGSLFFQIECSGGNDLTLDDARAARDFMAEIVTAMEETAPARQEKMPEKMQEKKETPSIPNRGAGTPDKKLPKKGKNGVCKGGPDMRHKNSGPPKRIEGAPPVPRNAAGKSLVNIKNEDLTPAEIELKRAWFRDYDAARKKQQAPPANPGGEELAEKKQANAEVCGGAEAAPSAIEPSEPPASTVTRPSFKKGSKVRQVGGKNIALGPGYVINVKVDGTYQVEFYDHQAVLRADEMELWDKPAPAAEESPAATVAT